MKSVQVKFVVNGNEVEYSCLYIKEDLREKSSVEHGDVVVESCCCPEITMSSDGECVHLFLRGSQKDRDEEESYSDKAPFLEMLPDILEALLKFDERYSRTYDEERKSELTINGETFSFNTEEQKQIIKLLRIKI